jgi:hypothetical protein
MAEDFPLSQNPIYPTDLEVEDLTAQARPVEPAPVRSPNRAEHDINSVLTSAPDWGTNPDPYNSRRVPLPLLPAKV